MLFLGLEFETKCSKEEEEEEEEDRGLATQELVVAAMVIYFDKLRIQFGEKVGLLMWAMIVLLIQRERE